MARSSGSSSPSELGVHLGAQFVHVQAGGVDDQVGVAAQLAQEFALGRDAVDDAAVALEGVRAAHRLEAAHQGLVGGLQEHDAPGDLAGLQVGEGLVEVVEEPAPAYVDDDGDPGDVPLGAGAELHHRGDQGGRQVVDDEPAEVLQTLGGRGTPGAGHPGDDHQLGDRRIGRPGGLARRTRTHLCSVCLRSLACPVIGGRVWCCLFALLVLVHGSCPRRPSEVAAAVAVGSSSSMISPVAVFTAGAAGSARAKAATIVSAVLRPMPGTSQI